MVVNIRDPECPKHTFKLLIFPSIHLLQCPNQQDKVCTSKLIRMSASLLNFIMKDAWVNHIDARQKIIRNPVKSDLLGKMLESPTQENLPGFPSIESEQTRDSSMGSSFQTTLPDWVTDIPEDLDVWIAQRNFTEAVDLYESFQEFVESDPLVPGLKEIK